MMGFEKKTFANLIHLFGEPRQESLHPMSFLETQITKRSRIRNNNKRFTEIALLELHLMFDHLPADGVDGNWATLFEIEV